MAVDETQKVVHPPIVPAQRNIKLTTVLINSDMLLHYLFFEWTVAMLNSGSSTICNLSVNSLHLPQETWKRFLNSITLPQLSFFHLTSLTPVSFADMDSFLGHHPSIKILQLYGTEVPEGIWPPPSLTIPILPHLTSIIAHPFYVVWILSSLLLDKEAFSNLTYITISSQVFSGTTPAFNYALFDDALEYVAAVPGKIKLDLRFGGMQGDDDVCDWFEEHLAITNDSSKSSVISRLDNVTFLNISPCYFDFSRRTTEVLPDWLGMFPNMTEIVVTSLTTLSGCKLKNKEFVRKVALACQKAEWLSVQWQRLYLEKVRSDIKVSAGGGRGSEKGHRSA